MVIPRRFGGIGIKVVQNTVVGSRKWHDYAKPHLDVGIEILVSNIHSSKPKHHQCCTAQVRF